MLQANRRERAEEMLAFVVVLPQAYKRHAWNRVPRVEKTSIKILVNGNRYTEMARHEREPPDAQLIVLPACGQLYQAYVEAETGMSTIVEEATRTGKNPVEEVGRLIEDARDGVRRQPIEVGTALLQFLHIGNLFEVGCEVLVAPVIEGQRILLGLDDSVDSKRVSQHFRRFTQTWASIILEIGFGGHLPEGQLEQLVIRIAKRARRDFMRDCLSVAGECENAHISNDARRRRLRDALSRSLLHHFGVIWEYRITLGGRDLRYPHQGFERYDNVLRYIVTDVSIRGGRLKQRAEHLGVPIQDVYDYVRREKYRQKRQNF